MIFLYSIRALNFVISSYSVPGEVFTPDGDMIWVLGFNDLHKVTMHDMFVQTTMFVTYLECHSPYRANIVIVDCKQVTSQIIQAYLGGIPKVASLFMVNYYFFQQIPKLKITRTTMLQHRK